MKPTCLNLLTKASVVFWDFDGVVKESTAIKNQAYAQMFSKFGKEALDKVMEHHCRNGGISRELKIPLYFTVDAKAAASARVSPRSRATGIG